MVLPLFLGSGNHKKKELFINHEYEGPSPMLIFEDNIKMDLKYIRWEDVDCIHFVQNKDQRRDFLARFHNTRETY
jgi:hypothetical protein